MGIGWGPRAQEVTAWFPQSHLCEKDSDSLWECTGVCLHLCFGYPCHHIFSFLFIFIIIIIITIISSSSIKTYTYMHAGFRTVFYMFSVLRVGDFMHKKIYLQNIYLVSVGGISCTPALPSDIVAASGSVFIWPSML